jgi:serine/threonine protein kinase
MPADRKRRALALVVGVGRYRLADRISTLPYATADAEAVAKALVNPKLCGFPEVGVELLRDAEATRDEVVSRLSKWLPSVADGAEIVVIYFAGHGMMPGPGRESAYLLPYDADPGNLGTFGIEMGDLRKWVGWIKARAVVLCLDCCHAGKIIPREVDPAGTAVRDIGISPAAFQGFSVGAEDGKGIFLISSCDEGQLSHEIAELRHGLFTYHLLRGIEGHGDRDGDGRVGISELFEYVSESVELHARKFDLTQKPWRSIIGTGLVFLTAESEPPSIFDSDIVSTEESDESWVVEFERGFSTADVAALILGLRRLGSMTIPARFPAIFRCLKHRSEEVLKTAKATLVAIGWEKIAQGIEDLPRGLDDERAGYVLDGLLAIPSHPPVVELLDRFTERLRGSLLNRAILLVEQKRLSLSLGAIAELFRKSKSQYRIDKVLGQGLFASAYLAHDEKLDMDVVVRILRDEYIRRPKVRAQFLGRRCGSIIHQNLVLTLDVGEFRDKGIFYSVRNYVEGATLRSLLEDNRRFQPTEAVAILRQVVAALVALHKKGIVHGGIKPSNIFLSGKDLVVLGDPLAAMRGVADDDASRRLAYDYRYASPETFGGTGELDDLRSDFYALGCVAYELLCQEPPHVSDNPFDFSAMHRAGQIAHPASRGSRLGEAGDALIMKLLARSPTDRPGDAEALAREIDALRDALREGGPPSRPPVSLLSGSIDRLRDIQSLPEFRPAELLGKLIDADKEAVGPSSPEGEIIPPSMPLSPPAPAGNDCQTPGPGIEGPVPCFDQAPPPVEPWEPSLYPSLPPETAELAPPGSAGPDRDDPGLRSEQSAYSFVSSTGEPESGRPRDPSGPVEPASEPIPSRLGRYEILRKLGEGGMGTVYLAVDTLLDRQVAMKVPSLAFSGRPKLRERFYREARLSARLSHPNICPIYDVGEAEGKPYLTMSYVDGRTLSHEIVKGQPWEPRRAARAIRTLARTLAEAHSLGVVHRDLKPSNVMVNPKGELILMDFGLAQLFDEEAIEITAEGAPLGTPAYMSPEQARGDLKAIGPPTDIYSLGVIFYELLAGNRPFEGKMISVVTKITSTDPSPPSVLNPGADPALESICLRAMAKDPGDRFASMDAFAEALQGWLDGERDAGPAPPSSDRAAESGTPASFPEASPRRSRLGAVLAIGAVFVGALIVALLLVFASTRR